MDWPNDADGDVFRRLMEHGFDFSKEHAVDYNVDFDPWPPAPAALDMLESMHGPIEVIPPDEEDGEYYAGYVQFKVVGRVTYEGVTSMQRKISVAMAPFGGVCESWGVGSD